MRCTNYLLTCYDLFSNAREELLFHFENIYSNMILIFNSYFEMFDDNCLPLLKAFCKYISIILNTFENNTVSAFKQIKTSNYRTRVGR